MLFEVRVFIRANVEGRVRVVISYQTLFVGSLYSTLVLDDNIRRIKIFRERLNRTKRHGLGSRITFGYHAFEMLETSVLGLWQDLGLLL